MKSGIYKILNKATNKIYIGSAINLKNRWVEHRKVLRGNRHINILLQNAWNKYGENAFEFIVIECCEPIKLIEREQFWLDQAKCFAPDDGYNICKIAGNTLGYRHSADTINKFKNRVQSEETKLKLSIINKNRSKEINQRMGNAQRRLDKWPHEDGNRCKCKNCQDKRNIYQRAYHQRRNKEILPFVLI